MTVTRSDEKWVLLATILASSMAFIDSSALNVALDAVQRDLDLTGAQVFWVVNAYLLFLASLILVSGALGDRYGRKCVFGTGIIVFTLTSLLCGIAPSGTFLIVARGLQGIGGALMVPGSLAIITALIDPARRGTAIGTWSMFSTLTTIGGPILGGWLANQGLWRLVFFINVPLGIIALLTLIYKVPESRDEQSPRRLDIPGAVLVTVGLAGITYGFGEAPNLGFDHPAILFTLIGGILALIVFVMVESRVANPMLPLSLFKSRTFSGTNALTLFLYAALAVLGVFLPLNLVQVQGYSPQEAGIAFLPTGLLLAFLSRYMGSLVDRIGAKTMLTIGPALAGIGFFMFTLPGLTSGFSDYWLTYFPANVMLGIGMSITVAPLTATVMGSAPVGSSGIASGINNAVARSGGVLAVAILGSVALFTFTDNLESRAAELSFSADQQAALLAEADDLGAAEAPADFPLKERRLAEFAIHRAYIDTFRVVMFIAAVLAWISAGLAFLMVEGKKSA